MQSCFHLVKHLQNTSERVNYLVKINCKFLQPLTIIAKDSILGVWLSSEYISNMPKEHFVKSVTLRSCNNLLLPTEVLSSVIYKLLI